MKYIMIDIEADGPIPSDYSMISFGAIIVDKNLDKTFYGKLQPISENWIPEALAVSGFTREQTLEFQDPKLVMHNFADWIKETCPGKPLFISDNNGFDWQFINWYFHHFIKNNPFGFSSTNLGSLYKGSVQNIRKNFKYLRKTKHSHHPVDDARGNAEALITINAQYNLGIKI